MSKIFEPLTQEEIDEFAAAFSVFDKDAKGVITTQQLGIVMRCLNQNPSEAQLDAMVQEIDPNGTGIIDFHGFLVVMARNMKEPDKEEDICKAFRVFDKDGTGFVTLAELKHIMTNFGENLTNDEIEELIREAQITNTELIDYKKLVAMMAPK
ncbi:calmodulin-beta-like [Teleopsis dalmanni]|uniref:calmodulin-beta-like n=1 Tax=Teleopsis dalmanni TaxID=139649 RepID=UPI0018CDE006|nr:calmodulin-beta-like [Teleopsis dalmanni]XP_037928041.1 calmodulin-beta-like [Teleopsis dalmanni]